MRALHLFSDSLSQVSAFHLVYNNSRPVVPLLQCCFHLFIYLYLHRASVSSLCFSKQRIFWKHYFSTWTLCSLVFVSVWLIRTTFFPTWSSIERVCCRRRRQWNRAPYQSTLLQVSVNTISTERPFIKGGLLYPACSLARRHKYTPDKRFYFNVA